MISSMNRLLFWMVKSLYHKIAPRLAFLLEGSNKKTVH